MPFKIVRHDITKMEVDAIVNAANSKLQRGGGVCGAIFEAAGPEDLQAACDAIGHCETGSAVLTPGFKAPAKWVIHTVGPVWQGGGHNEAALLRSCYEASLNLALKQGLASVAFPLISSGIYGYPKEAAFQIAVAAITAFLTEHEMEVYLVVFDKKALTLSEKLLGDIQRFIDDHYVDEWAVKERSRSLQQYEVSNQRSESVSAPMETRSTLEAFLEALDESFAQHLLRLIDEKQMSDVETYRRANLDRRLFSKIRSRQNYTPSKATAIALAIALRLDLGETRDLLSKAGYALSHSSRFDLIIEYFIESGNYDILQINEALFAYDLPLLGA